MLNFLLDYFFRVTNIAPTPTVSTAFLKQVLIVVSPKSGVDPGDIYECLSMAEVAAVTDNEDAQYLFTAGMTKVFVLPMANLDLSTALVGHESDFYTILISDDFDDADIEGVKASLLIAGMTYTAKAAGPEGNAISITYADTLTGNLATVSVVGSAISVAIDGGVTTKQVIYDALIASTPAMALVDVALNPVNAADTQAAYALDNLENGAQELDRGAFQGVVGVSSSDKDFLDQIGAIANTTAFYKSLNVRNMFHAFGKLLGNPSDWKNQQYIPMPVADDVETLNEALNLFDDRISFVVDDAQLGKRLAFFVAGGDAIVAPYIKRNLEIDIQSKLLQYVADNQPQYTKTQAALVEDEAQKIIQNYIDRAWIEKGEVEILLEQENFVATGKINIKKPNALWRVEAEFRQTLV